ncbi:Putative endonuclease/exonuclease/phosphatase family protein [Methyloversatilis universalis FAM5]|uniref:Endonuclease/exonuclease/phosphatase family protein n=1 Tax=Methyloversatilis universalis (strain ATCC BAA-1314 / DSM 25237 / JCM 13912 / CCUG 52030 / FAM5) TaxID=1000565 RepID=F5R7H2_METUF|nr:endonuclease/exonuclease/phosphatase family protein [Methyloversatilis universalis]EGK73451.1 Putative endonuclease/exonuclease/phosphatase family protein [Methyloversatilis universalis FAM5]
MTDLRICTWNIHKGFSQFNRRMVVHELRERLRAFGADLVFLQEVQGLHHGHAQRHADWPSEPQYEFLADQVWPATAYGRNAVYDHGHHGNAILSRHPIVQAVNHDVSAHRFEQRGLLHCVIEPDEGRRVHALCVHLGLTARGREQQYAMLADHIRQNIATDDALIVAGDFNDWHNRAEDQWSRALGLHEAHSLVHGRPARSFPAAFPLLRLDRIYVRGLHVGEVRLHSGPPWSRISDHAALTARLTPTPI